MLSRFVLGAIVGGIAEYVWGEEIRQFMSTKGRTARLAAADTLQAVQSTAEQIIDSARDQVTSTLEAGQEVIRPSRNRR
ncbi:MAG TPA: YtxH domain-containing protein [Candidatus Nitrosotalea sp.]|nr:YtxH domain-containing protein [Candidatus Nitrosotalea sp.]